MQNNKFYNTITFATGPGNVNQSYVHRYES